jgi:hypothetical protein
MSGHIRWIVSELADPHEPALPRYVAMCREQDSFAALAWRDRHLVANPLMQWLQTLDVPPLERVWLGSHATLSRREAVMLLRFRREAIAKMSGAWPKTPDFALWHVHRGGRGHGRGVCSIKDDVVQHWSSIDDAAKAIKTSRDSIEERIDAEHVDRNGWTWWESAG